MVGIRGRGLLGVAGDVVEVTQGSDPAVANLHDAGDVGRHQIAAVGVPKLVMGDWVKPGAAVIDVGVSEVDGELVGDVDTEAVRGVARIVTPHRRGVGPMTITMLLCNTLDAYEERLGA